MPCFLLSVFRYGLLTFQLLFLFLFSISLLKSNFLPAQPLCFPVSGILPAATCSCPHRATYCYASPTKMDRTPQTMSQSPSLFPSIAPSGCFTTAMRKVINMNKSSKQRHLSLKTCGHSRELSKQGYLHEVAPSQRSHGSVLLAFFCLFILPFSFAWRHLQYTVRTGLSCSGVERFTFSCGAG